FNVQRSLETGTRLPPSIPVLRPQVKQPVYVGFVRMLIICPYVQTRPRHFMPWRLNACAIDFVLHPSCTLSRKICSTRDTSLAEPRTKVTRPFAKFFTSPSFNNCFGEPSSSMSILRKP